MKRAGRVCGLGNRLVVILTAWRVFLAIQMTAFSLPPSADESSSLNASNVPSVTVSDPVTSSRISLPFWR